MSEEEGRVPGASAPAEVVTVAPQAPAAQPAVALLDLVNADLRGKIGLGDRAKLTEDPQRWLGILTNVLRSVRDQIEERRRGLEAELARRERSAFWDQHKKEYNAWLRRARYFEHKVTARIVEVRRLLPDDDLYALLHDGVSLDGADQDAIRAWQHRTRKALLAR